VLITKSSLRCASYGTCPCDGVCLTEGHSGGSDKGCGSSYDIELGSPQWPYLILALSSDNLIPSATIYKFLLVSPRQNAASSVIVCYLHFTIGEM
jgi:hypothetical protein